MDQDDPVAPHQPGTSQKEEQRQHESSNKNPETSGARGSKASADQNRILRSFDRLVPRYCDDSRKRKSTNVPLETPECSEAKKIGTKKEYSKLKHLVPALSEREDLSKVEIIEETIRYIDALHHQLASRGVNNNNSGNNNNSANNPIEEESANNPDESDANVSAQDQSTESNPESK